MVKVKSSLGGTVQVEVKGVNEALRMLRAKQQDIKQGADTGTFLAANFIQQEVQESIIGNRAEPKSVATGRFANSITLNKKQEAEFSVFPLESTYPGTNTTTTEVAKSLEYGTSKIQPRMHFRNSVARNQQRATQIIKDEIKRKI